MPLEGWGDLPAGLAGVTSAVNHRLGTMQLGKKRNVPGGWFCRPPGLDQILDQLTNNLRQNSP
jgi:hypothetical protein